MSERRKGALSKIKWVAKRLGIAILGIVVLLVLFVAYLHTGSGGEMLRGRVETRLRERVTTSATVGKLQFSLFSGITLHDIAILDRDGQKAIVVKSAHIVPNLGDIVGGVLALDMVTVDGVVVDVRGRPDGTTNLTGLANPKAKRPDRILVRALAVKGVAVHFTKPDGLLVDVDSLSLDGRLDTRPPLNATSASISLGIPTISIKKPDLAIVVSALATRLAVDLAPGGRGQVKLGPTGANLEITREKIPPVKTKLSLPDVTVDLTPERLVVALETLELAAFSALSARVEATRKEDGSTDHVHSARITKLVVRAADVEALAGRRILASDLDIDVDATGPKEAFAPEIRITTGGGQIVLRGKLDLRDPKVLKYEVSLATTSLDVNRVVASEKVPPLVVGKLDVVAKGERPEAGALKVGATVALRDVHVRDVTIDALDLRIRYENEVLTIEQLDLRALGQNVTATGTYRPEGKLIDVELSVDAHVAQLLGKLRAAGVLKTPPSPLVSALALRRPAKIRVHGPASGEMIVETSRDLELQVAGGSARASVTARIVRGDAEKGEKAVIVRHFAANADVASISLAEIGRLRGKPLPVAGRASGRVHVSGDVVAPEGDADLTVDLLDPETSKERVGTLHVKGGATASGIDARVTLTTTSGEELARIDAKGGRGAGAPLHVTVDVPDRPIASFAPLLRPDVRQRLPPDARLALHATVDGRARDTHVEADLSMRLRESTPPFVVHARAEVAGPVSAATTAPVKWSVDLDGPETAVEDLHPLARQGDVRGSVALAIHAKGTRADLNGNASITVKNLSKGGDRPIDGRVVVTIADDDAAVDVDARVATVPVLTGKVRAALGGRGLLAAAAGGKLGGADPKLDGKLQIPDGTMESRSRIAPDAHGLPGHAGGSVDVAGTARNPAIGLKLAYAGYRTLDGTDGSLAIQADGTREHAHVEVRGNDTLTLAVDATPREIFEGPSKEGSEAKLHATLKGEKISLASLVPDGELTRAMRPEGTVDAKLEADAAIVFHREKRELGALSVRGPLTLTGGALVVPTTSRRIHHVGVEIEGDGEKLAIRKIEARESDRDEPNRWIAMDGAFAIRDRDLVLQAKTHRVLVSGGNFGELDAPRAALTADLGLHANLSGRVRQVEVDVRSLDLVSPDRQPRAVQQEVLSLGDVLELRQGLVVGKLPVQPRSAAPSATPPSAPRPEDKTLDIAIRIPNPIHVKQRPLDLFARGEVHVERFGERRVLSGKLDATDGSLLIGGREHHLAKGEVRMTDEGPLLDLHFRREPHPAALRDMTTADDPNVYAHMVGIFGKQKISVSGKADGLFEALALENIGRVRVRGTPDAPTAQTPQLPQMAQIRQTAFMSANLPHLAFLDRMDTYADPNVSRFAYGRFENLQAERYSKDGQRRIRTTVRSRVIGQSDGEVEGDLLFMNTPRVVAGVGVLGGTRVGGGPVIFWEWSSAD